MRKYKEGVPVQEVKWFIPLILWLLAGTFCHANITVPAVFSDHMVLQQNSQVTIWGWGKPGEVVTISGSWDPDTKVTQRVPSHSVWSLDLPTPVAGGPYQLLIRGYNTIEINDVLIGEVWLGSGQSNMEWTASAGIEHKDEAIAGADFPEIRFFQVQTTTAPSPQQLVEGEWVKCSPETMPSFSAVLYFFGKELHTRLGVPVGLISSAWGGTPVEIWMPEPAIRGDRLLEGNAELLKPVPWGPISPGVAYNAMIHPLIPFRIKGAVWYQGEANVEFPDQYTRALKTLIESWRAAWGYDLSFYYVQIAPFEGYEDDNVKGAVIRDQQRRVMEMVPGTGMVVVSDIGNLKDIHPRNKIDVGKRLSAWALSHDYSLTGIPFSGPLPRSVEATPQGLSIRFDHAENGLVVHGERLKEFEVMDPSGNWVGAEARVIGNAVEVTSSVEAPAGVRYGYRNDSRPALFNGDGLPASCFEWML